MTITLRPIPELIALYTSLLDTQIADMISKRMPGYQTSVAAIEQQLADIVCSQQNANGPADYWQQYIDRGWFDLLSLTAECKATIVEHCLPLLDHCPNESIRRLISVLKPHTSLRTIGQNLYAAVIANGEQSDAMMIRPNGMKDQVVIEDLALKELAYGLIHTWQHGNIEASCEARNYMIALLQEAYVDLLKTYQTALENMGCLTRGKRNITHIVEFDANNEYVTYAFSSSLPFLKYYGTEQPFEEGHKLNAWFHKQTQTNLYEILSQHGGLSVEKLSSEILYGSRWSRKNRIVLMELLVRGMFELHIDQAVVCGGNDHYLLITPQQYRREHEMPSNTSGSDQLPIAS